MLCKVVPAFESVDEGIILTFESQNQIGNCDN